MTTTEQMPMIGKKAIISYGTINFEVTIKDTKQAWGETLYLIEPTAGYGMTWVKNLKTGFSKQGDVYSF